MSGARLLPTGAVVRSVPWTQVVGVLAIAVAPTVVSAARRSHRYDGALLIWLVVAGAVAAFAYDEPSRDLLDAGPTTHARRVVVRFALTVAAIAASGVVVASLSGFDSVEWRLVRRQLPAGVTVLVLSVGVASLARRRGASRVSLGDVSVGPLAVLLTSGLAHRYPSLPSVIDDRHTARWWWLTGAAAVVAVWSTRDPYRR